MDLTDISNKNYNKNFLKKNYNDEFPLIQSAMIYIDNREEFMTYRMGKSTEKIFTGIIGETFCDILNKSEEIIKVFDDFYDSYTTTIDSNKYTDDEMNSLLRDFIEELIRKLSKINICLQVVDLEIFRMLQDFSRDYANRRLNNSAFEKESYSSWCKWHIKLFVDTEKSCILKYKNLIFNNFNKENNIFTLEDEEIDLSVSNCLIKYVKKDESQEVLHKKLRTQNNIIYYSYDIKSLKELLDVSFYQIQLQNFHIRKCIFCEKCFSDKTKQTRCNNVSINNPNKTCRELPIYANEELMETVNTYKEQCKRINHCFTYNSKDTKKYSKREINFIKKNKSKFLSTTKQMRKHINHYGDEEKKYKKYLYLYREYLNKIEQKVNKEKDFDIQKITKEYINKMNIK